MPERRDAMFRGEHINVSEGPGGAACGAADAACSRSLVVDGSTWCRSPRVLDRWPPSPVGSFVTMEGPDRQTDRPDHQHRHRRFGPRPGDGVRGAQDYSAVTSSSFRF